MKKLIPKHQSPSGPLVLRSDNTRVSRPNLPFQLQYQLKPGEFFYKTKSGKQVVGKSQDATVQSDDRTKHQKQEAQKQKKIAEEKAKQEKIDKGAEQLLETTKLLLPSTYLGPLFRNNGKSYTENLLSGEGSGNTVGNLALDIMSPYLFKILKTTPVGKFYSESLGTVPDYDFNKLIDPTTLSITNKDALMRKIYQGKQSAVDFLQSELHKSTEKYNSELAKRLGFKNFFKYSDKAPKRANTSAGASLKVDLQDSKAGDVSLDVNPRNDKISFNLVQDPESTSFHESLHRGMFGMAPWYDGSLRLTKSQLRDTQNFYDFLVEKTLRPRIELAKDGLLDESLEYLEHPGELATNLLEAGRRMGIEQGAPYPGKQKFIEILRNFAESDQYKSGILQYVNLKKPKRIWRGLTGTLFGSNLLLNTVNNYENFQEE